jgi:hypothetical protein
MFTTSKHNPAGGAVAHFDNQEITALLGRYQAFGDPQALAGIITKAQERAKTLIRFYGTTRYLSEAELLSDVNWKLLPVADKFDASKGSAFTFLSRVIATSLCTSVSITRKNAGRYVELNEDLAGTLPAQNQDELAERAAVDDLTHRIRTGVKTTLTDKSELSTQRWYIDSFTEEGFAANRCQCSNAAMSVFNLTHSRSRELFDLTMLETRRVLYDDLKPRAAIPAGHLLGTRCAWMGRFEPLLSPSEFAKFVTLARDLSPFVVVLINPESHSRRQDRNLVIGRKNLEWVLNGHHDAVPLFK